jgi:hypothetical protein
MLIVSRCYNVSTGVISREVFCITVVIMMTVSMMCSDRRNAASHVLNEMSLCLYLRNQDERMGTSLIKVL